MVLYMKSKKHCFGWCVILQLICPSLLPCYLYSTMLFKPFLFVDMYILDYFLPDLLIAIFFSSLNSVLFYSWSISGSISSLTFDIFSVLTTSMIPLHLMPHESLTFVLILVINKHKIHKHPEENHRDSYLNCYKYYIIWLKREGHLSHRKSYIL